MVILVFYMNISFSLNTYWKLYCIVNIFYDTVNMNFFFGGGGKKKYKICTNSCFPS